MFVSVYTACN